MTKGALIFVSVVLVFLAYVWAYDMGVTNREISVDNSRLRVENQQLSGELAGVKKVLGELAGSDEVADALVTKIVELERNNQLQKRQLELNEEMIGRLEHALEMQSLRNKELIAEIDGLQERIDDIIGVEDGVE